MNKDFTTLQCPYCRNCNQMRLTAPLKFHRCLECGLIYKNAKEQYDKVLSTYQYDYFNYHSADQKEGRRDSLFDHILDSLIKRKRENRLLDVGTGCGFFMLAARARGWSVKGIEPSGQSAEVACSQNKLDVFWGTLNEYSGDDQYDVITFINVLDHSAEPWREIERARDLLIPGGILYLRFPNGFLHTRLYKLAFQLGFADSIRKFLVFHEFPFTPVYIRRLLKDTGFSEIKVENSPPSGGDPHNLFPAPRLAQYVKIILYLTAKAIQSITFGRVLLGTSLEVIAAKI